jgi:C4-dicarboxylate-specific signal transduction histidine kinase
MMRYRLRTLMILLAIMPPMLAGPWFIRENLRRFARQQTRAEINAEIERRVVERRAQESQGALSTELP